MKKRKKSFKKLVTSRSAKGWYGGIFNDSTLLKRMDDYFKQESEYWRIKKSKR